MLIKELSKASGGVSKRSQLLCSHKRWVPIWISMLVLCWLSLAGSGNPIVALTQADNGKTIHVHTGDLVALSLYENGTTGYTWALKQPDATILALQSSMFNAPPHSNHLVGVGGTRVFTFLAKKSGTVHLQLKYWRSFVGDSSIAERYNVMVKVQS